jgi:epoxyqueuosine reductase QueG
MRLEALTDGPFTPDELSTLNGVEACVHCGLCLPVCPTYELLGTQMDSPRGRLLLIKAAAASPYRKPSHFTWSAAWSAGPVRRSARRG